MKQDLKLRLNINEYLPLRDVVFNTLREAIITGQLEPGERLMENQLANTLGVSRTPIREAIRKLELENLVVMVPRKGAEVASFTKKDIEEVLEIRAALESLSVRLACENIRDNELEDLVRIKDEFAEAAKEKDINLLIRKDVEFHDIILKSTHNDRLIQMLNNLKEQIYRFRVKYVSKMEDYVSLVKEHDEILESISNRDITTAESIAVAHIKKQEKVMIELVENAKTS